MVKILVVDDEKNIRLLLTQCLEEAGYTVVAAVDGNHALKKAEEEAFDLMLLDMKLPDIDGLQVLRRLRALDPTRVIVIITAHGTIETAVEAMKFGAADYLQKPFTPEEIRAIVQHNLAKKAAFQAERGDGFEECLAEARRMMETKQIDAAQQFLRKAIALQPDRPEPFNLLGVADEYRSDLNGARRMYRVALALDASYTPASVNLERVTQWQYDFMRKADFGVPTEEPAGK